MFCLCAHTLPRTAHIWPHLAMTVDYGKLRHFCDDPVCPDPVWKLSIKQGAAAKAAAATKAFSPLGGLTVSVLPVAIFFLFSQFCEADISFLSLQKQPNTASNLFQRGVEYGKFAFSLRHLQKSPDLCNLFRYG